MTRLPRPDSLADTLREKPWQTALGLCASAVWHAQETAKALATLGATDPEARRIVAAEALRALVKARRWLLDASPLLRSHDERELHGYLVAECDALAVQQGFCPVVRAAA